MKHAILALCILAAACRPADDGYARGHNLTLAGVTAAEHAQIVDAAIRAAFDVSPDLVLRMHPLDLPRTAGDSGGAPVSPDLVKTLRQRGLVRAICTPVRTSPKDTPTCSTSDAGYIIRTSDIFTVSHDTTEIYLSAEKYGASTGMRPEALRFEKVYELLKRSGSWRVVREGRLHDR